MKRFMIDIETLGTSPGCVVLSIGAVRFDRLGVAEEFAAFPDLKEQEALGLRCELDTALWWMGQSDEALAGVVAVGRAGLVEVLVDLMAFIGVGEREVWSCGNFDLPILEELFRRGQRNGICVECPWKHWEVRDFRTIKGMFRHLRPSVRKAVAHVAIEDARVQAQELIWIEGNLRESGVLS